ncbi:paired amphipathic helix protein Sin3a-like [Platysternon megacephalum]|uniref:Paired amphipathic helix protein Sin3a-like n=1 Tax=Platysternon megacephalum TaxID=55544 RepID=A0A4D9E1X3_9SAUR|nr:paired amphipathic helix protein Sin3a-like [Platysternon megacephalum]
MFSQTGLGRSIKNQVRFTTSAVSARELRCPRRDLAKMGLIPPLPAAHRGAAQSLRWSHWRLRPTSACDVCELDYKHRTQPTQRLPSNFFGALRAAPNLH